MDEYGATIRDHWKTWLPERYSQLEDPQTFFTQMGEQASAQVTDLSLKLQASHQQELNDLEYLPRVGRINAYRQQAREVVMADFLPTPQEEESDDPVRDPVEDLMDGDGMPSDFEHPLWAMGDDPNVTARQWATARQEWENALRREARQ